MVVESAEKRSSRSQHHMPDARLDWPDRRRRRARGGRRSCGLNSSAAAAVMGIGGGSMAGFNGLTVCAS